MPLWTLEELLSCAASTAAAMLIDDRFLKYGAGVRYVWGSKDDMKRHEKRLNKHVEFALLHERLQAAEVRSVLTALYISLW
jgi:hypothetical protein